MKFHEKFRKFVHKFYDLLRFLLPNFMDIYSKLKRSIANDIQITAKYNKQKTAKFAVTVCSTLIVLNQNP